MISCKSTMYIFFSTHITEEFERKWAWGRAARTWQDNLQNSRPSWEAAFRRLKQNYYRARLAPAKTPSASYATQNSPQVIYESPNPRERRFLLLMVWAQRKRVSSWPPRADDSNHHEVSNSPEHQLKSSTIVRVYGSTRERGRWHVRTRRPDIQMAPLVSPSPSLKGFPWNFSPHNIT